MKTKNLFYSMFISGLIFTGSLTWLIISLIFGFNFGCIMVAILTISTLVSGFTGVEYAREARNNPEQFMEDIKVMFYGRKH